MPYVKLDENILGSTVWFEDHATFRVWIYLLLSADPSGVVVHTVPKIAHDCTTEPDLVRDALERWSKPDPDSRTPDHDGARVRLQREPEWMIEILNFDKYRKKDHTAAERKRRERERKSSQRDTVTSHRDDVTADHVTRDVTQADSDAEAEAPSVQSVDSESVGRKRPPVVVAEVVIPTRTREDGPQRPLEGVELPGVPRPERKQAEVVGEAYLRTFNSVFGRRVAATSIQREVVQRVASHLRAGREPELLVALPILAKAEGAGDWASRDPLILLRDGKHKTTRDGQTFGATNHALAFAGRIDQATIPPRLALAARVAQVDGWLERQGATLRWPDPGSDPGPRAA